MEYGKLVFVIVCSIPAVALMALLVVACVKTIIYLICGR